MNSKNIEKTFTIFAVSEFPDFDLIAIMIIELMLEIMKEPEEYTSGRLKIISLS
jgi:hypothetical protein